MTDPLRDQLQATLGATYTLARELGGGGMSRVFVARDERLGRDVVVKVLLPELAEGLSAERFTREIRLAAALQHPHTVPVLTAGTTADGLPYYTMPFVPGESLRARLDRGRAPPAEAGAILRDVAKALAYAHARGVVHRDVKPENVLLHDGTAVVTDFGIAKAVSASTTRALGATLTQVGTSLGTPAYMAPEQVAGGDVDHRADLYAWGVLAYETLAGRHPFAHRGSAQQLMVAHVLERPPFLAAACDGLPPALAAVVEACLAKDPDERPASAAELVAALDAVAADLAAPDARRARPPARGPADDRCSIVVLPFENLSPDPENEFFADGLAEEISTDLARLAALRVIARNSAGRYRGTPKSPREVGRELGVRYLLAGSVRRAGASLRVTARLVEAETETQRWAERFSGSMEDVFAIQERIAREITAALEVHLTPEENRRLATRAIGDARAYEHYLRARHLALQFSERASVDGLALLERAIALDGERAPLLALRGYLHWSLANLGVSGADAYADAARDVSRALELDPDLAPALVARAMLEVKAERVDSALVLRLLHRAYAAERSVDACLWLAVYLGQTGRPALARAYGAEVSELDPLAPMSGTTRGWASLLEGDFDTAIRVSAEGAARAPGEQMPGFFHTIFLLTAGRTAEAGAYLARRVPLDGMLATIAEMQRRALAGDAAGARALAAGPALRAEAERDDQWAWLVAQALAHAGAADDAMAWLRVAAERGFVNARFVREVDRMLAPLRAHPDMPALLAYMERRAAEIARDSGL